MADDVAPSVLGSLRDVSFRISFAEGVRFDARVSPDDFDLRRKCITMVDVRINSTIDLILRLIDNVTSAPVIREG